MANHHNVNDSQMQIISEIRVSLWACWQFSACLPLYHHSEFEKITDEILSL